MGTCQPASACAQPQQLACRNSQSFATDQTSLEQHLKQMLFGLNHGHGCGHEGAQHCLSEALGHPNQDYMQAKRHTELSSALLTRRHGAGPILSGPHSPPCPCLQHSVEPQSSVAAGKLESGSTAAPC